MRRIDLTALPTASPAVANGGELSNAFATDGIGPEGSISIIAINTWPTATSVPKA